MALFRSIATVGGYTMVSRVLGFVRDVLVAAYLGAGPVADAFFVAFKFPNFFRRLFAEGAFNAAFVPMFAGKIATAGRTAARLFAEDTLAVLLGVLVVLLVVIEAGMPWFITLAAPGFAGDPEKFRLAVEFTRITFPYLLFISLVSLQGGVLNSLDRFAAVAATPILLNLCLIGALIGLVHRLPTGGHALAWGVAAAGVVQFVWLAWACGRAGMGLSLPRPRLTPEVRRLLVLMLPAALGSGVVQVNLLIDVMLASLLPTGAVSFLYYADRIYELPLAVVGIAIGTAILPVLSRQVRRGEHAAAVETQNRALEAALLLTLPAAAALIVLDRPIIAVLFERGAFGAAEVRATAAALAAYALGLPAYVLIKVLTPCFYAREDTRTPVKIAVGCVVVNTAVALAAMQLFAHVGIALATVVSAWLNVGLLAAALRRRGYFAPDRQLRRRAPRVLLAAALMAVVLWAVLPAFEPSLAAGMIRRSSALGALILFGLATFAATALVVRAVDLKEARRLFQRS
ncbi:MAG TPA: murein biosynthesis integral membrane protein MurJ [Alphaproteobacteria bacterium]